MNWRQNPQRVAWVILCANFLLCCTLVVVVPLGARSYLLHATRAKPAYVTAMAGTVQLQPRNAPDPVAVPDRRSASEGSRIVTDNATKALVTVFGDETSGVVLSMQLFQDTIVRLDQIRSPRFQASVDPHQIGVVLERGRVRITTQVVAGRPVRMSVTTPQANVVIGSGTFDIAIDKGETSVRARLGAASVTAANVLVTANSGERISVRGGDAPGLPVPDALNLVLNGSFESRLAPTWQPFDNVERAKGLNPGVMTQEQVAGRQTLRFTRREEDGAPSEVGILQAVNRDVQGYDSLVLRLDLELLYQSVPGGGYRASEYPVMVKISYTDIYGKDLIWVQGFYYQDLPPKSTWDQPTGEKAPLGIWLTYESPNLFDLLRDTRPARINSLSIYAAGHDYDSRIADVALTVR